MLDSLIKSQLMIKIILICLFFLVAIGSCRPSFESSIKDRANIETITINPKSIFDSNLLASSFIDSFIYIPLETYEDIFIGKIRAIYEWDNRFYIWDEQTSAIIIFNHEGKFIKKIMHRGRGPKEYVNLKCLYHNPRNGDLNIYCDRSQSILQYDYNGNFKKRIPCKFITADFTLLGEDSWALYGGKYPNEEVFKETFPKQCRYIVMKDNELIKKDLAGEFKNEYMREPDKKMFFFSFFDTTSLIESFGNDIYRIGMKGELIPRFYIDFGEYNYPLTFETHSNEIETIIDARKNKSDKWCKVFRIFETNEILYIDYFYDKYLCKAIYSKMSKTTYNIGPVWLNNIDGIAMPQIHHSCGKYLLGSIESYNLLQAANSKIASPGLKKMVRKMNEMDNPVIVKMRIKNL